MNGMRARGGYELDYAWKDGRVTSFTVRAMQAGEVVVECAGTQIRHTFDRDNLLWTCTVD